MSEIDTSAEAVERLAHHAHKLLMGTTLDPLAAATLRALAAERDALRADVAAREAAAAVEGAEAMLDALMRATGLDPHANGPPPASAAVTVAQKQDLIASIARILKEMEAAAAEAMRTEIRSLLIAHAMHPALDKQTSEILMQLAGEALTLDLPAPDALARVRAEAMREGMEQAAEIADAEASDCKARGLREGWAAAATIRDAIRAAAQDIKP